MSIKVYEAQRLLADISDIKQHLENIESRITFLCPDLNKNLCQKIDFADIGDVRVINILKNENIFTYAQLCSKTKWDLLKIPNFGDKSLKIIEDHLRWCGLRLEMIEKRG